MEKLKKCPFCSREAELRYDKDGFSFVVCANDGCYVRTDGHLNEDAAITAWNTRKPMERIVKRLEDRIDITWKHDYMGGRKDAFVESIEIVKEELS
jgi:hypothetical protein